MERPRPMAIAASSRHLCGAAVTAVAAVAALLADIDAGDRMPAANASRCSSVIHASPPVGQDCKGWLESNLSHSSPEIESVPIAWCRQLSSAARKFQISRGLHQK
jgi:hypothetical protein